MDGRKSAVVAGHICLDIIPRLDHLPPEGLSLFRPGRLVSVGPAIFSTGGPVSNTGLALYRLGIPTRLVAKIGADPFGEIVRALVEQFDLALSSGLITGPAATTSYSLIISPPGQDRFFLHHPGANDDFGADDLNLRLLDQAALFHFGYPPVMRRMYVDGGRELAELFRRAKSTGVTTSLDMSLPDPLSESGRADWPAILRRMLPFVDLFLPSFEEILYMLRREAYNRLAAGSILAAAGPDLLAELSAELIEMGAKIVAIKLGERGLYLRSAGEGALAAMGRAAPADPRAWAGMQLWAPCFRVNVVGTTGSGDATIAGFLSALLRGLSACQALTAAVAVGACNVEAADALSGLRSWEDTLARAAAGWERLPLALNHPDWRWDAAEQLWIGPREG